MRLVRAALLAVFVISSPATVSRDCLAADPGLTTQQIVSAVEHTYKDVAAIQADFTQTISSPTMGELVQKGRLQLKRPQKARWEFTEPRTSAMITDGQTMWVWDPTANQVIVTQDLSGGGGGDMMSLLTDLSQLERFFAIEQSPTPADGRHVLRLKPRDASLQQQFQSLELVLEMGTMGLKQLTLVDAFGATTRLDFAGVRLNPELPDGQFSFQVPAGATVIDTGGL